MAGTIGLQQVPRRDGGIVRGAFAFIHVDGEVPHGRDLVFVRRLAVPEVRKALIALDSLSIVIEHRQIVHGRAMIFVAAAFLNQSAALAG